MEKKVVSLFLIALFSCSCSKGGKKLSFEEAKEFISSHPQQTRGIIYSDVMGHKREIQVPVFTSLGNNGVIKTTENQGYYNLNYGPDNYVYNICYFDYNQKNVLRKVINSNITFYSYYHELNEEEYETITCQVSNTGTEISAYKYTSLYQEGERDYFVDYQIHQSVCFGQCDKGLRFAITNFLDFEEEVFSEAIDSYEFYLQDDCLVANEKVKVVVDKNGKIVAGGVKKESTDEFVTLQCDYTINSNGYCIDGKTYGKYKEQD